MRVHIYPLTCDVCGGEGMGTRAANAAAWNLYAQVVHSNPAVCRDVLARRARELEASAVSREGESKTADSAPVSVGGEDQPSAGAHLGRSAR